ncbi:hypothetical protein POTOM_051629 [Populus tomentosa]|uniref:Uncharacterized protein n=1 Tax=Populus tomentosa TaxID=118781 RepID=A0A8X7Y2E8_POPTO|nr:hypothetical protein POTOM_051629 [Populus tomentosa]
MAWKGKPNSVNHKVVASEKCISPRMVKPVLTMNHHHHYPFVYNHVRDKDSIFPASEWNYNDTATFCKGFFGVEPRPNWITAEFGGHVRASFSLALRAGML